MNQATVSIGLMLLSQGYSLLQEHAAKVAAGTITDADNQELSDKLGLDITKLEADAAQAKAEGR